MHVVIYTTSPLNGQLVYLDSQGVKVESSWSTVESRSLSICLFTLVLIQDVLIGRIFYTSFIDRDIGLSTKNGEEGYAQTSQLHHSFCVPLTALSS
jgi:hypothetical protein